MSETKNALCFLREIHKVGRDKIYTDLRKFIGDRSFYRNAAYIMVPIAIQSIISNAMTIIDTMMVGWIGQVTAVGTAAQIDNLMQAVAFGLAAGVNIFFVQFYGAKDTLYMKKTFGLNVICVILNALVWQTLSILCGKQLLVFFINDKNVVLYAAEYLKFSCWSFIPTSILQSFTFSYHGIQKTYVPLNIGIITTIFHIFLNFALIFGYFRFPKLGVSGAGLSLMVTQYVALLIHIIYAYKSKQEFVGTLKDMFTIPLQYVKKVFIKVYPLVINETLFGLGNSMYIKLYGVFGKTTMDSYYVGNQVSSLFYFMVNGISDATGAVLGADLGCGNYKKAKIETNYFLGLAGILALGIIVLIVIFARPIVGMFGITGKSSILLSVNIVRVLAVRIAFRFFNVIIFAALRAGGDSKFLMFIDSGIMWGVGIMITFFAASVLRLNNILIVILLGQLEQLVRLIIGFKRYRSNAWLNTLTF